MSKSAEELRIVSWVSLAKSAVPADCFKLSRDADGRRSGAFASTKRAGAIGGRAPAAGKWGETGAGQAGGREASGDGEGKCSADRRVRIPPSRDGVGEESYCTCRANRSKTLRRHATAIWENRNLPAFAAYTVFTVGFTAKVTRHQFTQSAPTFAGRRACGRTARCHASRMGRCGRCRRRTGRVRRS